MSFLSLKYQQCFKYFKNFYRMSPIQPQQTQRFFVCDFQDNILCADGKTCINPNQLCDGKFDCPDHSDEYISGPGLKCHVKSYRENVCILPQENVYSDRAACLNKEDLCFDKHGNLTPSCFQCLDGNHVSLFVRRGKRENPFSLTNVSLLTNHSFFVNSYSTVFIIVLLRFATSPQDTVFD